VDLTIDVHEEPSATVVTVGGELDVHTAPSLQAALAALDSSGRIVVDLTGVGFLDSTGLSVFVNALADARQATLAVVANAPRVVKVFTLTGLDSALSLHSTLVEALDA
jgi:anti-anti-sigma factor